MGEPGPAVSTSPYHRTRLFTVVLNTRLHNTNIQEAFSHVDMTALRVFTFSLWYTVRITPYTYSPPALWQALKGEATVSVVPAALTARPEPLRAAAIRIQPEVAQWGAQGGRGGVPTPSGCPAGPGLRRGRNSALAQSVFPTEDCVSCIYYEVSWLLLEHFQTASEWVFILMKVLTVEILWQSIRADVQGSVGLEGRKSWSNKSSHVSPDHVSLCLESGCQTKVRKSGQDSHL